MTAREYYKLVNRLMRIEVRLEKSRGTCMNLCWLEWKSRWDECWEAMGRPGAVDE